MTVASRQQQGRNAIVVAVAVLIFATIQCCWAFEAACRMHRRPIVSHAVHLSHATLRPSPGDKNKMPVLFMAETSGDSEESSSSNVDVEDEMELATPDDDGEEAEEDDEEEEDPEIVALKEQIAELEGTLKSKRRTVAATSDAADDYSQAGYARMVAEMENMRRSRRSLNSSNRSGSTAQVLRAFLAPLDRLDALQQQYGNDAFGQQYNAFPGLLRSAFTELGASDYTVNEGDVVDTYRMAVVETEVVENGADNTVLRVLGNGMELQGNVIRAAPVVASKAPVVEAPAVEAPDDQGDSTDAAAADDGAPAE